MKSFIPKLAKCRNHSEIFNFVCLQMEQKKEQQIKHPIYLCYTYHTHQLSKASAQQRIHNVLTFYTCGPLSQEAIQQGLNDPWLLWLHLAMTALNLRGQKKEWFPEQQKTAGLVPLYSLPHLHTEQWHLQRLKQTPRDSVPIFLGSHCSLTWQRKRWRAQDVASGSSAKLASAASWTIWLISFWEIILLLWYLTNLNKGKNREIK